MRGPRTIRYTTDAEEGLTRALSTLILKAPTGMQMAMRDEVADAVQVLRTWF